MDFPDQSQCTNTEIASLLDLIPMCLLRRQVLENLYSLHTESPGLFILYDFSGHKPDLEGEIQIWFRYGFPDQPQCTNSEMTNLLDLTSMCLLRRQISETYTLFTLRVQVFSDLSSE